MVGEEWYDWGMSNSNQDAELFEKATNWRRLLLVTTGGPGSQDNGESGEPETPPNRSQRGL